MSQLSGPATIGPGSGTVTSITFSGGLTATPNPITTIGTATLNQTNLTVLDGTVYWDTGTQRLNTTATGTSGQVLTSNGAGLAPTYQTIVPTGVQTITGGLNITITGTATNPIVSESQAVLANNYSVANATPYVATATDYYITVDTSTTAITIRLPDAPTNYRIFIIKDSAGNASVRNVTVTTVSGIKLLDAAATFVMNTNYQSANFLYDGFGYQVF